MKCGQFSLIGTEGMRCGVYSMRCGRWDCPVCGPRKVKATIARVRAGMALGTCRFFTLTSPGDEDGATSYAQFPVRWKRFRMRLERRFGRIEYLGVVEPQRRGAAHVHVVYRGPFIPQQWLSRVAAECGFGRIADIRRSNPALMRYLAKYLSKDLADPVTKPPRYFRRVRWSTRWCVWEKRKREVPWTRWWIADAIPIHAAIDAARRGYTVEEVSAYDWGATFSLRRPIQWMRDLVGYRPFASLGLSR